MHITAAGVPFHRVSGANESSPASHEANTPLLHFNKRRPPVSLSLSVTFSLVVVLLSLFPLFPPLPPPSSSSSLPLPPPSPLSLPSLLSFLIPLCSCFLPPALSLLSPLPRWPVSLLRRGSISFPPPFSRSCSPSPSRSLAVSLSLPRWSSAIWRRRGSAPRPRAAGRRIRRQLDKCRHVHVNVFGRSARTCV